MGSARPARPLAAFSLLARPRWHPTSRSAAALLHGTDRRSFCVILPPLPCCPSSPCISTGPLCISTGAPSVNASWSMRDANKSYGSGSAPCLCVVSSLQHKEGDVGMSTGEERHLRDALPCIASFLPASLRRGLPQGRVPRRMSLPRRPTAGAFLDRPCLIDPA